MIDLALLERYGPKLLEGLGVTLELVLLSVTLGALLALPLALARLSGRRLLALPVQGFMSFFRGTPLLAQVFLVYYGAGQFRAGLDSIGLWWLFREAFFCAVLTFTFNTAAYQAEIMRGAIKAVPRGQWEAGDALGLPRAVTLLRIILPQAYATALRPLGNELILMIKGSAIASIITVFDLMGATKLAFSRSFDFQVYLWAALMYLVMVEGIRRVWNLLELRLTRHLRRA